MAAAPDLPAEVLAIVVSLLPNRDIKNLRLANRFFHATAKLRLSRVFLSANPLNIKVFRAIADDDSFRHNVIEIIWDDARLKDVPSGGHHLYPGHDAIDDYGFESPSQNDDDDTGNESRSDHGYEPRGVPRWFAQACRRNIQEMRQRDDGVVSSGKNARATQLIFQLRFQKSWKRYRALLEQQREVLKNESDAETFRYGLQRFTSLQRVVVTPAAHGWLFQPLYQTPMIRAFKYGFNYPIPRGWPTSSNAYKPALPWTSTRHRWRGVCIALRELARVPQHRVTQFVVDSHHLKTGLNSRMFQDPNPDYDNLLNLLRRPGFSHLHLDLLVGSNEEFDGWPLFRRGHLSHALGEAKALKHVSIGTDVYEWQGSYDEQSQLPPSLRCLFPVHKWPVLEHLGLRNFLVNQDDLATVLAELPATLRSIQLSSLQFSAANDTQDWSTLLCALRDKLDWQFRSVSSRPKLIIGASNPQIDHARHAWIDGQFVNDFLYNGAENPFVGGAADKPARAANIYNLIGRATETDPFDESFVRPWIGDERPGDEKKLE